MNLQLRMRGPGGVAERLIAPVLKTGRPIGLVSSNLTPSAKTSPSELTAFLEVGSAIGKIVLTLSIAVCQSRARAKSVRRLPQELHLTRFPRGLTVSERLVHTTKIFGNFFAIFRREMMNRCRRRYIHSHWFRRENGYRRNRR